MAWHPVTIDDSITRTGGGSIHVGQGQYLFQLAGVVPSKEDYEGEPHFRFELVFLEGPDPLAKGQKIAFIATFKEDAQFGLGTILESIGGVKIESLKGKTFRSYDAWTKLADQLTAKLKGSKLGGTVTDNSYNGRINSRVERTWPASEWDARRSAIISTPSPAPAPSTNGTAPTATAAPAPDDDFLSEVDSLFS